MNESAFFDATTVDEISASLQDLTASYSQIVVLTDNHTNTLVLPLLKDYLPATFFTLTVPAGESSKTIEQAQALWKAMFDNKIDRGALLINVGGGVVSDIGGFLAATYKRGIDVINIPTSLLAMVDAAVGGKNGINWQDQKNQLGTIRCPKAIFTVSQFLDTLSFRELRAGYAEMLKHGLISSEDEWEHLQTIVPTESASFSIETIQHNRAVKRRLVQGDREDRRERQFLNFGHTMGHAIEAHFAGTDTPLLHGEAVALGLILEIMLSHLVADLSFEIMMEAVRFIASKFQLEDLPTYEVLEHYLHSDKKKQNGKQKMVLLNAIGEPAIVTVQADSIKEALRFYQQLKDNKC